VQPVTYRLFGAIFKAHCHARDVAACANAAQCARLVRAATGQRVYALGSPSVSWRSLTLSCMTAPLNKALMQISKRAETNELEMLMSTFVDVGPLITLLETLDNQIVQGRRGTGKTHALRYLARQVEERGDWSVFVDLRQVGSSGGLYADSSIPISERGTRLLLDVLAALQSELVDHALIEADRSDMSGALLALDHLADEITQVRVVGEAEEEQRVREQSGRSSDLGIEVSRASIGVTASRASTTTAEGEVRTKRTGVERHYVHFGAVGTHTRALVEALDGRRIWLLLDEWSALPIELQPILADLIRRSLFPTAGIVVKIAAIEHRSQFSLLRPAGDYIGIEVGADVSANVDLDDFMVFGNNADQAQVFFRELLFRHVAAVLSDSDGANVPDSSSAFLAAAFTQASAFDELVRAAEGVPRDAINVVSLAAQQAQDDRISVNDIRSAARRWYQRDKEAAVATNESAERLLNWIVDRVIGLKRTKGFLLDPRGFMDPGVRALYDARVLHLLRRGISSRDSPGVRFNAYALDFGCYVHLTAARAPTSLFEAETEDGAMSVTVPGDDYRSIRTAILDLSEFYAS
jgi:hypothetical protein